MMNSTSRIRLVFAAAAAGLFTFVSPFARGQAFYVVSKTQVFFQTGSSGSVPDPSSPFKFGAEAATNAILAQPSGSTQPLAFVSGDNTFQVSQSFATKAALDAAFPNGTYRMTGTGIPTLSFNLTTDAYPADAPRVIGGTWNAGGVLVVDPTQTATITLSTFTGYGTSGAIGHMQTTVRGLQGDNVNLKNDIVSQAAFGLTVSSTPLTSITIPARTLTSGKVYQAEVQFDTLTTLDTTSVTGGGAVAIFTKGLQFYIAAQAPGTTSPLPVIISQPTNQTGVLGGRVTFGLGVTINGVAPSQNSNLTILWYFNGQQLNINGIKYTVNGGGLTVNNLTTADVGNYYALLISAGGIVTSNTAALALGTAAVPTITRHPTSQNVLQGGSVSFSIEASGTPTPNYQWQRNGVNVPSGTVGANSSTLLVPGASSAQAGTYTCIVTNGAGSVTSAVATLTITTNFNDPGRLSNLSVLTDITAAVPSFTLGTVVGGGGTSGNKPLIVRAVGPSLGALGVPGTILDPKVDLFAGQTVMATNDNWGTPAYSGATSAADLRAAMASVGAFAFTGTTSNDAAIYGPALPPRDYTVAVSGVAGATGTVIAEIYDATPAGTFTAATSRLVNVSVLKQVNAGGLITLGFTIGGSTAKTILLRAIGPGLTQLGVPGVMADPQLTLFNSSSAAIATNDDWGGDPALNVTMQRVGAFAISNSASKDAMLLVTLPPGGYTAQARGLGDSSGLVIVEAYEVP